MDKELYGKLMSPRHGGHEPRWADALDGLQPGEVREIPHEELDESRRRQGVLNMARRRGLNVTTRKDPDTGTLYVVCLKPEDA